MATSPTEQQNNRRTTFIGGKVKIQIRIPINWWKFNEILQRILTRQVMLLNNSWWHNYSRNKSMCYFKAPNWLNLVDVLINNKAKLSIQFQWTSNWTQYYSQKYTSTSHSFFSRQTAPATFVYCRALFNRDIKFRSGYEKNIILYWHD